MPLGLVRVLATLASAAVLSVLAPPLNLHQLHWIAYLPMFWALREETPKENRRLAFLFGTVAVGLIFRWLVDTITLFSNIPAVGAYALLGLFSIVFGLQYIALWSAVHPLRKRFGDLWILALPALQVLIEFLAMNVFLFPYNQGVSQYRVPFTWQLVSVTGVWGLTFLVLLVNAALAEGIYRAREGRPFPVRWVSGAVSALSLTILWGAWRFDRIEQALRDAPVLRVAQIQSDVTMTHRMSEARQEALYEWLRETDRVPRGAADLVVWSEGASPFNVHEGRVKDMIAAQARRGDFELLLGGGTVTRITNERTGEPDIEAYNSVYLFDRAGEIAGRYDKNVPLPFGEYMPLSDVFPWLADAIDGPGDFRAGTELSVLEGQVRYAAPICYEAILPSLCRRFDRPSLLVNVTNDAWFGDTAAPHQHAMLAAVRATELGVPLVRSGYTGVSFVVEPHGHIHAETRPFTRVTHIVPVRSATFPTLYGRFGDWFVLLCAIGLGGGWLSTRRAAPPPA